MSKMWIFFFFIHFFFSFLYNRIFIQLSHPNEASTKQNCFSQLNFLHFVSTSLSDCRVNASFTCLNVLTNNMTEHVNNKAFQRLCKKTLDTKFKGSEHLPLVYRKTVGFEWVFCAVRLFSFSLNRQNCPILNISSNVFFCLIFCLIDKVDSTRMKEIQEIKTILTCTKSLFSEVCLFAEK